MTFVQMQDRVMGRLNLSSATARTRLKEFLNERYRNVATSIGLGSVRRATVTVSTVAAASSVSPIGLLKPITISIPALNRVLEERTMDQLRLMDTSGTWTGDPQYYAIKSVDASAIVLELRPIPDAVRTLSIDGIVRGVELFNDDDIPVLPEDFHDILIFGTLADEYDHFDKAEFAARQETKFQSRLGELRYFLQKSAYLTRGQGEGAARTWWQFYGSPWL